MTPEIQYGDTFVAVRQWSERCVHVLSLEARAKELGVMIDFGAFPYESERRVVCFRCGAMFDKAPEHLPEVAK